MATKKWFKPKREHTGWSKDLPMTKRRSLSLKAHKGNNLSTARSLQALANVTRDKTTKEKATADAKYFYKLNAKKNK